MSANGTNESKPINTFQTDLIYGIFYIDKVLNDNVSTDLDDLNRYIKDLKLNLAMAKPMGTKFATEIVFAEQLLELDNRVRTLKFEQKKYDEGLAAIGHAAKVLLEAGLDTARRINAQAEDLLRRSPSPYNSPPHILTSSQKQKAEIIRKISSPPPGTTGADASSMERDTTLSPRASFYISKRPSNLSVSGDGIEQARATSPYPMPPATETIIILNDAINDLQVKVKQYYKQIEKDLHAKQEKQEQSKANKFKKS